MNLIPSPQISEQVSLVVEEPPEQDHPVSILHEELHPSLLIVFPSSQKVARVVYFLPSAQISVQVSFEIDEPPEHIQPVSLTQVELQPSPETLFPSSQKVELDENFFPSPHTSMHTSLKVVVPPDHVHPDSIYFDLDYDK